MFEAQRELQKRYGFDMLEIGSLRDGKPVSPEKLSNAISSNLAAIFAELQELSACFFDLNGNMLLFIERQPRNAIVEIVDAVHFAANIGLLIGLDLDDIKLYINYDKSFLSDDNKLTMFGNLIRRAYVLTSTIYEFYSWKHWKASHKMFEHWDFGAMQKTIAELFNVFMLMAITLDKAPYSLVEEYFTKNKINHDRIDNGY